MADIATIGLRVDSKGVVKATKDLDGLERQGNNTTRMAGALGKAFGVLAGALAGGKIFRSVIANTIEQERVTAQLEQTLRSTGRYTPELSQQMQDYASSLQSVTAFGDEAIIGAQALLLTFTQIGEEAFPRANEAILDVATAMGTDLKSAALQVGKALNDPILGVTALARSGIQFTQAQKDMIKEMVETNRVAEAQSLILDELEVQFGGSARAARDTLGGAITSLKNAFGDLLEGDSGSDGVRGATEAINDLTDAMSSSETKQAFATLTAAVFRLLGGVTNLAVEFSNLGDQIAINLAAITGNLSDLDRLEQQIKDVDRAIKGGFNTPIKFLFTSKEELQEMRDRLVAERSALEAAMGVSGNGTAKPAVPRRPTEIASPDSGGSGKAVRDEIDRTAEAYRRLTVSLSDQRTMLGMTERDAFIYQAQLRLSSDATNDMRENVERLAGALFDEREEFDALQVKVDDTTSQMTEFAQQAARNMQDAFADGFFDLFTGQTNDLAETFSRMLQRMAADLAASSVLNFLVGDFAGTGKMGGLLGSAISSFGGARADGGPVSSGKTYLVGERGPELFTPKSGGQIIPNGAGGGSVSVNVNVDASGSSAEGNDQQANQLGRLIGASVRSIIIDERRPGGLLG